MIYVTGDCHADFRKFNTANFPEQRELGKDDYVIICGDFGGIWDQTETKNERYWLDWLDAKPYTTLFVDGNHENFDRVYSYPERDWHGGRVNVVRDRVLHLCRGYVFDIDGKSVFAFGGARSHDIRDGVLDPDTDAEKIKEWEKDWDRLFRVKHRTWWEEEMPSRAEMDRGLENLRKRGMRVDMIVTHDCASSTLAALSYGLEEINDLNRYLEKLKRAVSFEKWYFGHRHDDRAIDDREIMLYDRIEPCVIRGERDAREYSALAPSEECSRDPV